MARQYGDQQKDPRFDKGRPGGIKERRSKEPEVKEPDPSPPTEVVEAFHKNAAVGAKSTDIHHRIGIGPYDAASGTHSHDGGDSTLLLQGYTIVGSKATPSTVLPSIIAALVRLGAKDSTT